MTDDDKLGMHANISRRDFLGGASVAVGSTLLPDTAAYADVGLQDLAGYYPPAKTGMRGSHAGSYEVAHGLRDGKRWDAETIDEHYDLVVVGAGISGLAAAFLYQQQTGGRVLVVDNHDDFGGHAKRNEFQLDGELKIGYGGTMLMESPSSYPTVAKNLLRDIGIDIKRFDTAFHHGLYSSLGMGEVMFFDAETFGRDHVEAGDLSDPEVAARLPLPEPAKADIQRLFANEQHYLGEMPREDMIAYLESVSYRDYLEDKAGMHPQVIKAVHAICRGVWAVDIDAFPALEAWSNEYPGYGDLDLKLYNYADYSYEPSIHHFPDGNASIARMLVRKLVPGSAPGASMDDIVTARFDYSTLDRPGNATRIRLNSTVTRLRHQDDDLDADVDVTVVRDGKASTLTAGKVVVAGYNAMVPYLCPEMPAEQRAALGTALRAPLVYTNVLLTNWRGFRDKGIRRANCPGSFFHTVMLDFPVSLGDYPFGQSPDEPMVLHMNHVPVVPGKPSRVQFAEGRRSLYSKPFEVFERHVRDQLARMLDGTDFDVKRDIAGITVNRWPHGYAYGYDPATDRIAFEPSRWPESSKPWLTARQRFGNISLASSDSASNAMSEAAIVEAQRAIDDLGN
ncbi:MAG: NAD(P)-binding protein [Pseudomonadota bacterium]